MSFVKPSVAETEPAVDELLCPKPSVAEPAVDELLCPKPSVAETEPADDELLCPKPNPIFGTALSPTIMKFNKNPGHFKHNFWFYLVNFT